MSLHSFNSAPLRRKGGGDDDQPYLAYQPNRSPPGLSAWGLPYRLDLPFCASGKHATGPKVCGACHFTVAHLTITFVRGDTLRAQQSKQTILFISMLALLLSLVAVGWAADPTPAAAAPTAGKEPAPNIAAVQITEPPAIDGRLDDACWQQASHVAGFWRTAHDLPEFERTEAWIAYTSKAIYVALRCYDSEAGSIKATQRKRQGSFSDDDYVGFWLDVAPDAGGSFYSFRVNPLGTQLDSTPGGTSEKVEWKGDWRAAAAIDTEGWSVEMEIPFSILRYAKGQTCFRFDLARQLARRRDYAIWPAQFARAGDAANCARWTGISMPPVPFRSCFMPFALTVFSEDDEDRELLTLGLDYKGTFPNGIVGLATVNPDFRNLEDVVEKIQFTSVERYLPEYRPFFQEGSGFFPGSNVFYSRRIENFDWGLKSFGRVGANGFGILDAYSRGGKNHLIWEFDHRFGTTGGASVYGVAPRLPGEPRNTTWGMGASREWPFEGGGKYANGSWSMSQTAGDGGDDEWLEFETGQYRQQGLGWRLAYSTVGPEFVAQDGYVPETGVRIVDMDVEKGHSFDEGAVESKGWNLHYDTGQSEDGRRRHTWAEGGIDWRNGLSLFGGAGPGEKDGFSDGGYWAGGNWTRNDRFHKGGWGAAWWHILGFPSTYYWASQAFRITDRWCGEVRVERNDSAQFADDDETILPPDTKRQLVLTHTYDLTDERTLAGRIVIRDSNRNFYLAYRQRVRKGTDLLIVVGDPNADEWVSRVAVKAIWCY